MAKAGLYLKRESAHQYACMAMKALKRDSALLMTGNMIESVASRFRALGEPQRLRILQVLEGGPKPVNEVVGAIGISQPTVSRHLQALYDAGLVSRRRSGTSTVYFISDSLVFRLCDLMCRSVAAQARAELEEIAWPDRKSARR
jgi:DNA-binding transcriptional ArsR family regulator